MIFVIDNYDSFTYNLVQYFGELGQPSQVMRNDAVTVDDIAAARPDALVISPGPCTPEQAGISMQAVLQLGTTVPVLGVCLGHQAIAMAHGGKLTQVEPMHGKLSQVHHEGGTLFEALPNPLTVTRYHSLVVDPASLPKGFVADAWTLKDGDKEHIMAMRHRQLPLWGVQFHPESIQTTAGKQLLGNFLQVAGVV